MEVITIESIAFSKLLSNIENLTTELRAQNQKSKTEELDQKPKEKLKQGDQWLYNEDVCKLLRVTKRTLQNTATTSFCHIRKSERKFSTKRPMSKSFSKKTTSLSTPENGCKIWLKCTHILNKKVRGSIFSILITHSLKSLIMYIHKDILVGSSIDYFWSKKNREPIKCQNLL